MDHPGSVGCPPHIMCIIWKFPIMYSTEKCLQSITDTTNMPARRTFAESLTWWCACHCAHRFLLYPYCQHASKHGCILEFERCTLVFSFCGIDTFYKYTIALYRTPLRSMPHACTNPPIIGTRTYHGGRDTPFRTTHPPCRLLVDRL